MSPTGTNHGVVSGRVFAIIGSYWLRFLQLFQPQDSAESVHHYTSINSVITMECVSGGQCVGSYCEIRSLLPYMQCLKHQKKSPDVMRVI